MYNDVPLDPFQHLAMRRQRFFVRVGEAEGELDLVSFICKHIVELQVSRPITLVPIRTVAQALPAATST